MSNRTEYIGFRASVDERALVEALAQVEERTESDVLRRLVREAARRRGLLDNPERNPPAPPAQKAA